MSLTKIAPNYQLLLFQNTIGKGNILITLADVELVKHISFQYELERRKSGNNSLFKMT